MSDNGALTYATDRIAFLHQRIADLEIAHAADLEEARKTAVLVKQVSDQRAELAREREEKLRAACNQLELELKDWIETANGLSNFNTCKKKWSAAWKRAAKRWKYLADGLNWKRLWEVARQERNELKARAEQAERQLDEAQSWACYFYELNGQFCKERDEARRVARRLYYCAKNERRDGNEARSAFVNMMQFLVMQKNFLDKEQS